MEKFLEKMRAKDVSDKKSFAFVTACIITGLIFVIWLLTMQAQFKISEKNKVTEEPVEAINNQ